MKKMKKSYACLAVMLSVVLCCVSGCASGEKNDSSNTYPPLILEQGEKNGSVTENITAEPISTDVPVYVSTDFEFTGKAYIIANEADGSVIASKNADDVLYIASITKLLTALVALDHFEADDYITVQDGWFWLLERDKDIDAYGMKVGSTYKVEDILKLLIIKSYGDAALTLDYAVAEKTGRDFKELMNEKAASLGMADSHFDNAIGLDIGNGFTENYSTASDTAKLMRAAYNNELLFEICSMREAVLEMGATLKNTGKLFGAEYCTEKYSVLGGKTGSTNASGVSIACVCNDADSDMNYIIIYLNGNSTTNMCNEIAGMLDIIC